MSNNNNSKKNKQQNNATSDLSDDFTTSGETLIDIDALRSGKGVNSFSFSAESVEDDEFNSFSDDDKGKSTRKDDNGDDDDSDEEGFLEEEEEEAEEDEEGSSSNEDTSSAESIIKKAVKSVSGEEGNTGTEEAERIRQEFVRQQNQLKAELEKVRKEKEALAKQTKQATKLVKVQNKKRLEAEIQAAENDYFKAVEDDDVKAQLAANKKISSLTSQLVAAENALAEDDLDEEQEADNSSKETPTEAAAHNIPVAAVVWAEKHKNWLQKDAVKTQLSKAIILELKEKGEDITSFDFYRKVDTLLDKAVEYMSSTDKSTKEKETSSSKPKIVQKVSSSGQSSNSSDGLAKRKKVTLSRSEIEAAKRLGVPPAEYAKQKMKLEKTNYSGWTPIF